MIGICFELRQPHIVNEYIEGESLKDLLIKEGETISVVRRVKMVRETRQFVLRLDMNFISSSNEKKCCIS